MAQLTRANFETELSNRGWSRYAAELERYLDWGLRDVVREARWKDLEDTAVITDHGAAVGEHRIMFSQINSGAVQTVKHVRVTDDDDRRKLIPMDQSEFDSWSWRDMTEDTGVPMSYFIDQDSVWLRPAPDKNYDFEIDYIARITAFANDGATSGLPERFDEAILCAAEAHCFRRAHEFDRMAVAQSEMRRIVLAEMVDDGRRMEEESGRVIPYR